MKAWHLFIALLLGGCGSELGGFTGTRQQNLCSDAYPVCNTSAGCVLTEQQYAEGVLPGTQQIIFRTDRPARVRVRLLFLEQRSPRQEHNSGVE